MSHAECADVHMRVEHAPVLDLTSAPTPSRDGFEAALAKPADSLGRSDAEAAYWKHDELLVMNGFLDPAFVARLRTEAHAAVTAMRRKSVPGYKRAGAVSAHALARHAPALVALYRSPTLITALSRLADVELLPCPKWDAHAVALYVYTQRGDRVGFHYDRSFYRGARYTALLGLQNDSKSQLVCRVHRGNRHRAEKELRVCTEPGTLVFFQGDKCYHSVSPLGADETRIVLSLQYVTSTEMGPLSRILSELKDAFTYFGV